MKETNKQKLRYTLIVVFSLLIIINLLNAAYDNLLSWNSVLNILSAILMLIAMVLEIKHSNKKQDTND